MQNPLGAGNYLCVLDPVFGVMEGLATVRVNDTFPHQMGECWFFSTINLMLSTLSVPPGVFVEDGILFISIAVFLSQA